MWHFKVLSFWLIRSWIQEELFTKSIRTIIWQQKKLFSFPGNSFCWYEELQSNNTAFHKKKTTALNYNAPDFHWGVKHRMQLRKKEHLLDCVRDKEVKIITTYWTNSPHFIFDYWTPLGDFLHCSVSEWPFTDRASDSTFCTSGCRQRSLALNGGPNERRN